MGPDELGRIDPDGNFTQRVEGQYRDERGNPLDFQFDAIFPNTYTPNVTVGDSTITATETGITGSLIDAVNSMITISSNARLDILGEIEKMPPKEKRKVLELLLEGFTEEEPKSKPVAPKINYLKQLLENRKKSAS